MRRAEDQAMIAGELEPRAQAWRNAGRWSAFGIDAVLLERPVYVLPDKIVSFDRRFYDETAEHWVLDWVDCDEECEGSC